MGIISNYMKKKVAITYGILILIILGGFFFRIKGVVDNHSFWSDEAYVSSFARDIVLGNGSFLTNINKITYQPLQIAITAFSFLFFGINEMAARVPSVLFGTIGIIFAFLIAQKLSNKAGGLLTAFIYSFSQLNLSNATQAKPYATLQTLLLIILYLISILAESSPRKKQHTISLHAGIVALIVLASLIHIIGFLFWIPYVTYLFCEKRQAALRALRNPKFLVPIIVLSFFAFFLFQVPFIIVWVYTSLIDSLKQHTQITFVRELLWRQYGFITLPALMGVVITYYKNKSLSKGVILISVATILLSSLVIGHFNIRYLVPIFGVLFIYFGVFWGVVGEKLVYNRSALVCLLIAGLLYVGGYKIVRKSSVYYSPNADLYGDIQNADYKTVFSKLKQISSKEPYVIANDVIDVERWYLPEHLPDAYFVKAGAGNIAYGETSTHPINKKPIYTTLQQFMEFKNQNPRGVIIIEDWQSILPEDIKQYAKKNLKQEIKVDGLLEAAGDNWPVEIYSWGM